MAEGGIISGIRDYFKTKPKKKKPKKGRRRLKDLHSMNRELDSTGEAARRKRKKK
jgi:hypothetical protein